MITTEMPTRPTRPTRPRTREAMARRECGRPSPAVDVHVYDAEATADSTRLAEITQAMDYVQRVIAWAFDTLVNEHRERERLDNEVLVAIKRRNQHDDHLRRARELVDTVCPDSWTTLVTERQTIKSRQARRVAERRKSTTKSTTTSEAAELRGRMALINQILEQNKANMDPATFAAMKASVFAAVGH